MKKETNFRKLNEFEIKKILEKIKFEESEYRLYSEAEGHTHEYVLFSEKEYANLQKGVVIITKFCKT